MILSGHKYTKNYGAADGEYFPCFSRKLKADLIRLVWTSSFFSVCLLLQRPRDPFVDSHIGDSITQGAWDQSRGFAMGAELASAYSRRLDVMNRGFRFSCPSSNLELWLTKASQRIQH